ncbi:NAD-binding protein, partial [Salmonella enterica subsp. enterica serovar Kentucky]|nr:NAD-binding protein [Salmonella enterica subsp. enterica serovar Kentucky]
DITVVDTNGERLRSLQDKFDLRVVQGHGSHPRVLREAGADDAATPYPTWRVGWLRRSRNPTSRCKGWGNVGLRARRDGFDFTF